MKSVRRSRRVRLPNTKAEGYLDTAIRLLIGVVIGGLLMAGIYALFDTVLLPGMAEHIQRMV